MHDYTVLPPFVAQGMEKRLGRGRVRQVYPIKMNRILAVTEGGASEFTVSTAGEANSLWEIDCPAQCSSLDSQQRYLAVGTLENIYIWDLATRKVIQQIPSAARVLALSPDGQKVAAVHKTKLTLYEVASCQKLSEEELNDSVSAACFSPNGNHIGIGYLDGSQISFGVISLDGRGQVPSWGLLPRRFFESVIGGANSTQVSNMAFGPDSSLIAVAEYWTGSILLCRLPSSSSEKLEVIYRHKVQTERYQDRSLGLAFNKYGDLFAFGTDKATTLVSVTSKKEIYHMESPGASLAFGADDKVLLTGGSREISGWSLPDLRKLFDVSVGSGDISSLAFTPDGSLLACSGPSGIELRDTSTGREKWFRASSTPGIHGELLQRVHSIAVSDAGKLLSVCGEFSFPDRGCSYGAQIYDMNTKRLKSFLFYSHGVGQRKTLFTPDGRYLAYGEALSGFIHLWDSQRNEEAQKWNPNKQMGAFDSVKDYCFRPDGKYLVTANSLGLGLWLLPQDTPVIQVPKIAANCVAFSPNGQYLATGSASGLSIWEFQEGRFLKSPELKPMVNRAMPPVKHIGFDSSSRYVAVAGESLSLVDVKTGNTVKKYNDVGTVSSLAFHPHLPLLATSSDSDSVRIWRL
ncbi:MAG: hypothetical protein KatS3mg050_0697 [Litorilinea sp.]|nr:MAG: hypothetical protein KatS3mg050_0697 [Litorilinea sp.]